MTAARHACGSMVLKSVGSSPNQAQVKSTAVGRLARASPFARQAGNRAVDGLDPAVLIGPIGHGIR